MRADVAADQLVDVLALLLFGEAVVGIAADGGGGSRRNGGPAVCFLFFRFSGLFGRRGGGDGRELGGRRAADGVGGSGASGGNAREHLHLSLHELHLLHLHVHHLGHHGPWSLPVGAPGGTGNGCGALVCCKARLAVP